MQSWNWHAVVLAVAVFLAGCQSEAGLSRKGVGTVSAAEAGVQDADGKFAAISRAWLEGWLALNPINATQVGDHRFDGEIDDLSAAGRQKNLEFSKQTLAKLDALDYSALSRQNQVDAAVLRNQLQYDIWTAETLQSWAWDPQIYSSLVGSSLYGLMAREFAPLATRLDSAAARMEKLPVLLAQARANLDVGRVPKVHAETVAKQNSGVLAIVDALIVPHLQGLPGPSRKRLEAAIAGLKLALAEHQAWLDKTLVPGAKGDFRLGQALYDQKLRFALSSSLSRAEIRRRAEAELKRVRNEMYGIARTVLRGKASASDMPENPSDLQRQKAIEQALELAYADRPARDQVMQAAEGGLAAATAFVAEKDLFTLPDTSVKIITMPEFQRGVSVAYCDSPGPLDKGLDTFYAVSPIPDEWSQEQVDSFLREYNTRMIHLLSIHEGVPGHYLEGAHSAKFPSVLRALLRSGLFAEGWAVYTENAMAKAGYYGNDPLFRLVQLKFYLRTISNAILDQGVHVDGWTREQAMDLMMRQAFQQEREAAGKWVRAQLTSAQLPTYFVGVQEHFDMRKAVEDKLGDRFDAKAYHDQVLSYGAPPIRYVRQLILGKPVQ